MYRPIQVIVSIVFLLSTFTFAQSNSILFRFNANHDFSQNVSSTVEVYNVDFQKNIDSVEASARSTIGWGYYAPIYSVFSGDNSYLESTEKVRVTFAGDHKLSGEVWLKTDSKNGSLFSWNDSTQSHGIDLYLSNSKLNLERRFFDTTLVLTSNRDFKQQEWYHVIWTMDVVGSEVQLEFYINNQLDIFETFTLNSDVGFAIINAIVNIGKSSYKPELPNFSGILSAISFKSYIPQSEYLATNVPFDGSEYFGVPTYHNYNIGTMNEEADQRITKNTTPIIESAIVPYMDDDFIPQGITNLDEDNENSYVNPMVYTSMYNKTISGLTGRKKSIIVEMDPNNNYKVRRCFEIKGFSEYRHNGGLAFFNNKIYISTGGNIEVFDIPDYTEGSDKYLKITRHSLASVASIASYMTYYRDTVWVGDFVTSGNAYIKGYPLDETGKVINSATPRKYKVLEKAQGVAWTNVNGKDYLMVSVSYGDASSKIYRISRTDLSSSNEPNIDAVFVLPAGGEDLTFDKDKNLISQSESGTKYFQKRPSSPWNAFYPFIYKISFETLFGDVVSVVDEEETSQLPSEFKLFNNYPNPFNPSTTIKYSIPVLDAKDAPNTNVMLKVYDTLGREVATLVNKKQKAGSYEVDFIANSISSGIYFYRIVVGASTRSATFVQTNKMVLLK